MYIILKKKSANDISNRINESFENNNKELLKKIEELEINLLKSLSTNDKTNRELLKKIEELETDLSKSLKNIELLKNENFQHRTQMLYLETLLLDIHESSVYDKKFCPICKSEPPAFLPLGENPRKNAMCPNCHSLERHRLSYLFLNEKTNIFEEKIKMLHIAPEEIFGKEIFGKIFRNNEKIDYLPVDLNYDRPIIKEKMDIQDIEYPDGTFDFIYCSHVLEHVPNDQKAMKELYRVLKHEGAAVIMVPINNSLKETYEDPSINTPELRLKHYGQSSHLRYYGLDFQKLLEKAGFKVLKYSTKNFDKVSIKKYGLNIGDDVFYCTK